MGKKKKGAKPKFKKDIDPKNPKNLKKKKNTSQNN